MRRLRLLSARFPANAGASVQQLFWRPQGREAKENTTMMTGRWTRQAGLALCVVILAGVMGGCSGPQCIVVMDSKTPKHDADLIKSVQNAVDGVVLRPNPGCVKRDDCARVLVATPVNLDNLRETSTFGRLVGEIVAGRMAHWKYTVVDMNIRQGAVKMMPDGALSLSRDVRELATNYDAALVLVSTYTVALDKVYLSLKLVSIEQNGIIGAVDIAVPKGPRTVALLGGSSESVAVETTTQNPKQQTAKAYYRKY
jgi:hypothetical protein